MSSPESLTEHARRNRAAWDADAPNWVDLGERAWSQAEPNWGLWGIPEAELRVVPDVDGKDVLELGCGTAYWSAWLARRGARVVGLDNSERQLETARRLQREHGLEFPLIHASAESVPLPDSSYDLVISEYGACLWCDPALWIPEASRLLRPGGQLVFLTNGLLVALCAPDEGAVSDRLLRDLFGLGRMEWTGEDGIEFHLSHGDMIRTLRANGLAVLNLVELRAPEGADPGRFEWMTLEWARRWPSEEIWVAAKP